MTMTNATSVRATAVTLAWVAAATAVLDLVVLAVLHALRNDVDPATDPVSDYAVGDYGTLKVLATLAVGLGALALTAALRVTGPRRSTVGLVLLAVFALAKVTQAFFPIDVGDETTAGGGIHNVLGTVAFFALPVAAVLVSLSRGRVEMVVAVLLAVAVLPVLATGATGGYGIAQRVFLVLSSTWVLVTAVRPAIRRTRPSHRGASDRGPLRGPDGGAATSSPAGRGNRPR
jgi:nitrate reductase NapE component